MPDDLYRIVTHGDPRIAASGEIYFVRTTLDREKDAAQTFIVRARGADVAAFTTGPKDGQPRLAPGGDMLAFTGDRGDGARVYVISTSGGEARAITATFPAITAIEWSPTGDRIAFVATAPHDPATARSYLDEPTGARHIRRLPFKSDLEGLLDGRRKHLFTVNVDGASEPVAVTSGDFDVQSFAWAPDARSIVISAIIDRPETAFSPDLHTIDLASRKHTKLTPSLGPSSAPSYSSDGDWIAFIGNRKGDLGGGRFNAELCLIPAAGGDIRSITADFDRSLGDWIVGDIRGGFGLQAPKWIDGDRELLVTICSEGASSIRAFRADGSGQRTLVDGERHIVAFDRAGDGTIAFVESTPLEPSRVVRFDGAGETVLTDDNAWLQERSVRAPRRLRPRAADGTELDAWILDPDEPARAPLVLEVHGGPHAAYGFTFFFEFQMLASHGIGVAYGNPRGGQSYGEGYADAITGRWGELDAADVLSILDAVEAAGSWDPARIGIAGGSYGGFMTSWLLGHSKRFCAGVSMRAVNEFLSEYTASDINIWIGEELDARWDDAGAKLFARSPMRAAHEIDAALLVEHSERDYRCPIDQADSLFTLLRTLGRENVEYVRFTGDGHELSRSGKPRNRVLRLRAIAQWFIRHLRPAGVDAAPDEAGALFAPLPGETVSA